ncbi:MAG TPA: hypothetical protein VK932_29850, partial [Kofleriaceae bacterium]|nr:hypothetical protein [Kofleriaceae bacterium]
AERARARLADPEIAMAYVSLGRIHAPASDRLAPFDLFLATGADFDTAATRSLLAGLGVPAPEIDPALVEQIVGRALDAEAAA